MRAAKLLEMWMRDKSIAGSRFTHAIFPTTAIQLKKVFDTFGVVTTEVVISPPEMRESEDEIDETDDDLVRSFWRKMMERYGGEEAYNKTIIEQFKGPGDPDVVIVVEKLLTGFDAPRAPFARTEYKLQLTFGDNPD
jgi:hypothetical protein